MEKTEKSSKKKLTIAILALTLAVLCVTGTLIAVYAATSQSIGATFSVEYNIGTNVAVKASAYYQYLGDTTLTSVTPVVQVNTSGTIVDGNGNTLSDTSITIPELQLDDKKTAVRLVYTFENIGGNAFSIGASWDGLNYDGTDTTNNYNISLGVEDVDDNAKYTSIDAVASTDFTIPIGMFQFNKSTSDLGPTALKTSLAPGETYLVVITISINDVYTNAECNSKNNGNNDQLQFFLSYVDTETE